MSYNISFLRAGSPSELSGILRQVKTKIESDKEKEKNVEGGNGMGEKTSYKNLLILDDMTAIADKTPTFGHFLTTCRKLNLSCMYVFHKIHKRSQNWNNIISQTHIFILFQAASNEALNSLLHDVTVRNYELGSRKRDNWIFKLR